MTLTDVFSGTDKASRLSRLGLVLVSGLAATAGFAPYGFWWATMLGAFGVFFAVEKSVSVKEAALLGWCWGLAYFALGLSWTHRSMAEFGGLGDFPAALGVAALAALLAATYALPAALARRLKGGEGTAAAFLLPAGWVAAEVLRTDVLGFGWLTTGYAFDSTLLVHWAPVGGVHAVAAAGLFIAGAAAAAAVGMKNVYVKLGTAMLAGCSVLVAAALEPVAWSQAGARLDVRLVQPDLPVALAVTKKDQADRLARVEAMSLASPLGAKLDLIVWPEGVYAVSLARLPADMVRLAGNVAARTGAAVLFNAFDEPSPHRFYNALWLATAEGGLSAVYAKRHLVPFGEFVPFGFRWFVDLLGIPMADQQRGAEPSQALHAAGHVVGAAVCYENSFPNEMRSWWSLPVVPDYLVTVANLGWFSDKAAAQFTQMSAMRSRELARPQLQVVNNAASAVIDAAGRVERLASDGAQNLDAVFMTAKGRATPFSRWGDGPLVIFLGLIFAVAVRLRMRRGR